MTTVLATRSLVKRFGGLAATNDVSLDLVRGARHALIGPNGAGKTTLINLLTGVLEPTSGTILLDGDDITSLAAHKRVRRGVVRTFQINQLFNALTPLSSLALAVSVHLGTSARWWRPLGDDAAVAAECETLLARFRLADVMDQPVHSLAYGKRRLLEIAGRACSCSTSRSPASPKASAGRSSRPSTPCPPRSRSCSSSTTWTSSSTSRRR
jgi:branched-chain amino acid transport system ATP-binding protein